GTSWHVRGRRCNVDQVTRDEGYAPGRHGRGSLAGNRADQRGRSAVLLHREGQVRRRCHVYETAEGRECPSNHHYLLHVILLIATPTDANEIIVAESPTTAAEEHGEVRRATGTCRSSSTRSASAPGVAREARRAGCSGRPGGTGVPGRALISWQAGRPRRP